MRSYRTTAALCLILAGATVAAAEDTKPAPDANQATSQPAPPKAKPLTPEEVISQSEAVVRRGTAIGQGVRGMLEEAHKESDIIKITCLDDKLTQINVNLRTAETRLDSLRKAVDPDLRVHEYTVLTVLGQKLQVLDQEAHQCVGQAMYETGATRVTTVIDTSKLPSEDNPQNFPIVTPAAPVASPPEPSTGMM